MCFAIYEERIFRHFEGYYHDTRHSPNFLLVNLRIRSPTELTVSALSHDHLRFSSFLLKLLLPTMSILSTTSNPTVDTGDYNGFRYEIFDSNSTTAIVKIHIPADHSVKAIPGCMVCTSPNIEIKGKLKKTFKAMLGPDDARHQTFTAKETGGWVVLAPGFYGSIRAVSIADEEICVGDDAYLASFGEVESTSVKQGMKKALFSGHGLFVKKVKGSGVVLVCAVGSMLTMELADGEDVIVDTGHMVTWPRHIKYEVTKASKSWFGSGLSGEGMVSKVTGPGKINIQSRNPEELAEWVYETKMPPSG